MPDIKESLKEINKQIKDLKTSAAEASKEVRNISQEMRIDTANVDLVISKYNKLGEQLESNRKLLDAYNKKEKELSNLLATEKDEDKKKQLAKELEETQRAADKATESIKKLQTATSNLAKNNEIAKAKTEELKVKFEGAEQIAQKFSVAVLAVVAALTLMTKKSIETAVELYSLSKSYNANVEEIQEWNNRLYLATGQADLYNKSLSVMTKGMAQIAAGRGVAYEQALNNIGLSYKELIKLNTAQQFEEIFNALSKVTDVTERAAAAQTLFGDSGLLVANVAGLSAEEMQKLNEQTNKFAILSSDTVENLANLNIELQASKSQLSEAEAELTVALTPAILALADILVKDVIPVLTTITGWFSDISPTGQKIILFLLAVLIVLPKIIAFVKILSIAITGFNAGIKLVTASTAALNIVTAQWQVILIAIAAVIIGIIALLGVMSKSAREATSSLNETIAAAQSGLSSEMGDLGVNTESYTSSKSEKTVTINAEIYGHGDTEVSDESAKNVALLTVDEIQKSLGGLI